MMEKGAKNRAKLKSLNRSALRKVFYVCACMRVCMYSPVWVHVETRGQHEDVLNCFPTLFISLVRDSLSLNLELTIFV